MIAFRVWLRPLGFNCRVQVDGLSNTQWLLGRLGKVAVFKTSEPIGEEGNSPFCTFKVPYSPQLSRNRLERMLAGIPEVTLMSEPE